MTVGNHKTVGFQLVLFENFLLHVLSYFFHNFFRRVHQKSEKQPCLLLIFFLKKTYPSPLR